MNACRGLPDGASSWYLTRACDRSSSRRGRRRADLAARAVETLAARRPVTREAWRRADAEVVPDDLEGDAGAAVATSSAAGREGAAAEGRQAAPGVAREEGADGVDPALARSR